jgi:CRP/FNR family transcriptional regulator, anaerobic regulatory protein
MEDGAGHEIAPFVSHRRIVRGEAVHRAGDPLHCLYTIRAGFFKTVQSLDDGREQVTGFHMPGDILGLEAIGTKLHGCDAIALEDSRVCAILYSHIEDLARSKPELQDRLRKVMSAEIVRERNAMLILGVVTA